MDRSLAVSSVRHATALRKLGGFKLILGMEENMLIEFIWIPLLTLAIIEYYQIFMQLEFFRGAIDCLALYTIYVLLCCVYTLRSAKLWIIPSSVGSYSFRVTLSPSRMVLAWTKTLRGTLFFRTTSRT